MSEHALDAMISTQRLVFEEQISAAIDEVGERIASNVDAALSELLQKRSAAGQLAWQVGLSPSDLGLISCIVDRSSTADAARELGITEEQFMLERARIISAISRYNRGSALSSRVPESWRHAGDGGARRAY